MSSSACNAACESVCILIYSYLSSNVLSNLLVASRIAIISAWNTVVFDDNFIDFDCISVPITWIVHPAPTWDKNCCCNSERVQTGPVEGG